MLKLAILVLFIVAVLNVTESKGEKYKSRLDNINLKDILKNDRLVNNYIKCALEKGKCTPDGRQIKEQLLDLLPEILETNCAKCTEEQIEKSKEILSHMREYKRPYFDEILDKYDHDKELRKKYREKYSGLVEKEGYSYIFD